MKGFYNSIRIKKDTVKFIKDNIILITMFLSVVMGIVIGSLLIRNGWFAEQFNFASVFKNFVSQRSSLSTFKIILFSASSNLGYLCLAYFIGLFAFGTPFSFVLLISKGIGIGTVCGYLYSVFGLKGVAFAILIILPNAFISSVVLSYACNMSYMLSKRLLNIFIKEDICCSLKPVFSKYSSRYLVFILLMLISSIVDAVMSSVFIGVFGLV